MKQKIKSKKILHPKIQFISDIAYIGYSIMTHDQFYNNFQPGSKQEALLFSNVKNKCWISKEYDNKSEYEGYYILYYSICENPTATDNWEIL